MIILHYYVINGCMCTASDHKPQGKPAYETVVTLSTLACVTAVVHHSRSGYNNVLGYIM